MVKLCHRPPIHEGTPTTLLPVQLGTAGMEVQSGVYSGWRGLGLFLHKPSCDRTHRRYTRLLTCAPHPFWPHRRSPRCISKSTTWMGLRGVVLAAWGIEPSDHPYTRALKAGPATSYHWVHSRSLPYSWCLVSSHIASSLTAFSPCWPHGWDGTHKLSPDLRPAMAPSPLVILWPPVWPLLLPKVPPLPSAPWGRTPSSTNPGQKPMFSTIICCGLQVHVISQFSPELSSACPACFSQP